MYGRTPSIIEMDCLIIALFAVLSFTDVGSACSCERQTNCISCTVSNKCWWDMASGRCNEKRLLDFCYSCRVSEIEECPRIIYQNISYNEQFAKYIMFRLASASRTKMPQQCLSNISPLTKLHRQIFLTGLTSLADISALTAVSEDLKAILISFGATTTTFQYFAQMISAVFPRAKIGNYGEINCYHAYVFKKLWFHGLEDDVSGLVKAHPTYEIWISGLSMGGALANLGAHVIAKNISSTRKIKLLTFAPPRICDANFGRVQNNMIAYQYHVVHSNDVVTHFPPVIMFPDRHSGFEVWYNNHMETPNQFQVCSSAEDCRCSNSLYIYSTIPHNEYFGVNTNYFADTGCTFY